MAKSYMKLDGNLVPISVGSTPKEEQTKTVTEPNFSSGDVVVTPDDGKVLTQVTVVKDNDLVPENIVKDVDIFGVVGTAETKPTGGYTLTIESRGHMPINDIHIMQTNGNNFLATLAGRGNVNSDDIIFENVTYIQKNITSGAGYDFYGITYTELNTGKTLENDVRIVVRD